VRLVIAVFSLLLALAAPASARDVTVTLPARFLTNDPAITIGVDPPDTPLACALTGETPAPCTSGWRPVVGADGLYRYDVVADGYTFGGSFTLDRTPPAIAFTAGPADYSFVATDAHPGTLECTVDGAAAPCSATVTLAGDHTLAARAVDAAGNESTATRTLTLAQPQVTHVDPKPEGGVLSTTASSPSVKLNSTHTRRWTRLHSLTIRDVEAGTAVKATCKGTGCPKRALRVTAKKGAVSLAGLTGRKLSPGTVIKITLSAKGKVTRTFTITIRATRAPQIR
jgi:hypothetical protein